MSDWFGSIGDWFSGGDVVDTGSWDLGSIADPIPDSSIDTSGWDWSGAVDSGGFDEPGLGYGAVDSGGFDEPGLGTDAAGGGSSWLSGLLNPRTITSLLGGAAGAAGNLIGAGQATNAANNAALITAAANAQALDKVLAANKEARDVMVQRSDRGLGEIDAGLGKFRETLNPLLTPNPIVIPQHRGLTPQQQIGLDDLRRSGLASLAATGMRGAGRAGIGTIMDQERRYRAAAAAGNDADTRNEMRRAQGVADAARSNLATGELQTGGAKANANMMVGTQLGSSITSGGQTAGQLAQNTGQAAANAANTAGQINANATTSTANLVGDTLGNLGAIFADQRRYSAPGSSWGV